MLYKNIYSYLNDSLDGIRFKKNGDGSYSYYGADGSLVPFNNGGIVFYACNGFGLYGNQPFNIKQINNTLCTKGTMSNNIVSFTFIKDTKIIIHFYCYDRGTPKGSTELKVNNSIKNTFTIVDDNSTGYFTYTISIKKNDVLSFEITSAGYKNDNAISIVAECTK